MARKNRPRAAREALSRQAAATRRGAPGKRFIGETAGQQTAARRAELERVALLVEQEHQRENEAHQRVEHEHQRLEQAYQEQKRAVALARPLGALLGDLAVNFLRLTRTVASAPFRLAAALRGTTRRTA